MEDKMCQANSCAHSGLQGGGPGNLLSWYTSLYSHPISPQEVLYPTSWTVGTSTLGSSPGGSLPETLANCLLHLFLSRLCGMQEGEQMVGSTSLPPWIFIEKQVCIQAAFCLPSRQPFILCQVFCGQILMPLITMLQLQ